MTKNCGQNATTATANRGVEVKEMEIVNIELDRNTTSYSSSAPGGEGSVRADGSAPDTSGSYIQVAVQRAPAPPPKSPPGSPRLPHASSPLRQLYVAGAGARTVAGAGAGDAEGMVLVPASLLLACGRAPAAASAVLDRGAPEKRSFGAGARSPDPEMKKPSTWQILSSISTEKLNLIDNGPERVEVYYFEQGADAYLATCSAARATACERWGRRGARAAAGWLAELPAATHLLLAAPLALIVTVERCVLMAVRDAVTGCVQTASDYLLKPALALAFNALLLPPLVCLGQAARAARRALRPLALALGDALEPPARLLAALRLVHVQYDAPHAPHAPVRHPRLDAHI